MADGDFDVRILQKTTVTKGGFTTAGVAVNDKQMVVGTITFTYNTNGLVVAPVDLGLSKIDAFFTTQVFANNDTAPTAAQPWFAVYNAAAGGSGNIIITDDGGTEATDSQTGSLSFLAFGDSAFSVDLT